MCVFTVIGEESVPSKLSELCDGKNSLNYHHHDHINIISKPASIAINFDDISNSQKENCNALDKLVDSK